MGKIIRRFKPREEAEAAGREDWRRMTPDARIRILLEVLCPDELGGVSAWFPGRAELRMNKQALGRPQHPGDPELLN